MAKRKPITSQRGMELAQPARRLPPLPGSTPRDTPGGLPFGPGVAYTPPVEHDPPGPVVQPEPRRETPPQPPPEAEQGSGGGGGGGGGGGDVGSPPRPGLISAWVDGVHRWYDAATGAYYDNGGNLVWSPTGGGGDGGATGDGDRPFIDWTSILAQFGLPQSLIDEVMAAFGSDPNTDRAVAQALAYVRGSAWYDQTFAGIGHGIRAGLFTGSNPEVQYRQWLNQVQQTWARYNSMGGTLDRSDIELWLSQGFDPGTIEKRFQGAAYADTYGADIRYATGAFDTDGAVQGDDLQELGRHQAGLNSARGLTLADRVAKAQARMERVFQGVLATPLFEQRGRGIAAASLQPQRGRPDIGA